ncbi:hypothetical protein L2K20_25125 [Mycobacterium sp. MBM]|nr:hypothetical protein [Mycobacterium sp. MBM]
MPDEQQSSAEEPLDPEIVAADPVPVQVDPDYSESGVPTLDYVREKVENRWGNAIGAAELAEDTPEGRSVAEQYDARQRAAAERLAQIRESMKRD